MTQRELARYLELKERLERNEETLESLRSSAEPGAQRITGMPSGKGAKDRIGNLAAEIRDFEAATEALRARVKKAENQVFAFISGVKDERMRLILRLRFVRLLTWQEIADMLGGENTDETVRRSYYRYMEKMGARAKKRTSSP